MSKLSDVKIFVSLRNFPSLNFVQDSTSLTFIGKLSTTEIHSKLHSLYSYKIFTVTIPFTYVHHSIIDFPKNSKKSI